ncbi:uncharacterized protein LOC112346574 [Selaginella moellendorffii]|uniref:uncharacterized protein LOC112346574 n=1 Tax=Selaginella moellendorffii TaxID=88036 RepID=UPI000D1C8C04|nr:uncharacterized protein LOC112346574 [Selaginella moellendorffii]|eukprot:XP_024531634.1 uncharacterized protein LOC112346574 [Selaginella moellendorffii]
MTSIKKGELILVSNSAAFERGGYRSICDRNTAVRLLDMAMKSPRAYKLIHSLACEVAGNERGVPAMEIFQPDWATPENCSTDSSREALQGITVQRFFEMVSQASFNPKVQLPKPERADGTLALRRYLVRPPLHQPLLCWERFPEGVWHHGVLLCHPRHHSGSATSSAAILTGGRGSPSRISRR